MMIVQCPETGAKHLVETLEGYAGWTVLADSLDKPAHDYIRWDEAGQALVEDFASLDAILLAKIDANAGAFRTQFITSIPGQETTYRLKEEEAKAWGEDSDPADFPYLREEAAAKGVAIDDVAALVLGIAAQWNILNPKIEAARVAAKDAVLAAQTFDAKHAAAQVDWWSLLQSLPGAADA